MNGTGPDVATWYDDNWRHRQIVVIDLTAGGSGPITVDVSFTIPSAWDLFWDNVLVSGFDLRITDADGTTTEVYQRKIWTHASNIGTLEIDNVSLEDGKINVLYLYWGNAAATDVAGNFSATAIKAGHLEMSCPAYPLVRVAPQEPGADRPRDVLYKGVEDETFVWWDLTGVLLRRCSPANGAYLLEGVDYIKEYRVLNGGQLIANTTTVADNRLVEILGRRGRRVFVKTLTKGGADGTDYTLELQVVTTEGRILNLRAWLKVRDVDEA